jgi:hypothetical protein
MKCNCLDKALTKILNNNPSWNNKKVSQYYYSDGGISFTTGESSVGIGIDIKYEGQKKEGHTYLTMAFCPLCGKSLKKGGK